MVEKRKVSEEILELFMESDAADDLATEYLNKFFGTRKAIKFKTLANKKRRQAWKLVRELYPDYRDKALRIEYADKVVYEITE